MNTNEFARSCKQLRKKYNFESSEKFIDDLKELFLKSLGQPEDMSLDIWDFYIRNGETIEDRDVEKLSDLVDLFMLDYSDDYNQLGDEDWGFLKELVNTWALEMDMDTVTYIMQKVVDAGGFS